MRDLLEFLAKSLVDNPDDVQVTSEERSQAVVIELRVSPDDMGKVIGRQGRIAKAIRTIVKAASFNEDKPYYVEIM
jgi:predicted RNA-binding protein YlqC (UPF0109 family)